MGELTVKEKIDAAYSAAWEAMAKSLTENGLEFDDCDTYLAVDDKENKKSYSLAVTLTECPEYNGN